MASEYHCEVCGVKQKGWNINSRFCSPQCEKISVLQRRVEGLYKENVALKALLDEALGSIANPEYYFPLQKKVDKLLAEAKREAQG